jgi:hypothetical protein
MISQLDIYVDKVLNPKVLIVKDASWYNPDVPVTNAALDIKYPGSTNNVHIPVGRGFSYIINSNTLGLTNTTTSAALTDLPDGLYTIRYSICPNDELFVEYTFLRNVKQLVEYNNLYCAIEIEKCNKKHYTQDLEQLRSIKDMIDAAEYQADCGKYTQAIDLYNYAESLLKEFTNGCNCF